MYNLGEHNYSESNHELEKLSKLIHEELWTPWAKEILSTENVSIRRQKRWKNECFKSYENLSEEMKDLDRIFARKILNLLKNEN